MRKISYFSASMIVAFPEPRAPKEKSHPIFFCPLGSLDTVYTVVISKNQFAYGTLGQSLDYSWWLVICIVCLFVTVPFLFPLKVGKLDSYLSKTLENLKIWKICKDGTWYTNSLPKEHPKVIWITWHTPWALVTSAFFQRKLKIKKYQCVISMCYIKKYRYTLHFDT